MLEIGSAANLGDFPLDGVRNLLASRMHHLPMQSNSRLVRLNDRLHTEMFHHYSTARG